MSYNPEENDDDIKYCLQNNQSKFITIESIKEILAEVSGANDELNWWWILERNDGKFVLISAWCDYTGWDCQSKIDFETDCDTALECAMLAPQEEKYSQRNIRDNLIAQLKGKEIVGIYNPNIRLTYPELLQS